MLNNDVINDSWKVDIPDHESFKSFEYRNKSGIYDYGCLITPLNPQIDNEYDLKSDILSKVCCNTFLRSRALDVEWKRIREHVFNFAKREFGSVFDQIKHINIKDDYSNLPVIISNGSNIDDFDITYYTINRHSDIIAIKLNKSKQIDDMIKEFIRQISRKFTLKRGKSPIKRLIASRDSLRDKVILVIISEINPELLFSLQLIREWTEIPIACLILNVINNDLFESHIPYNLYSNIRIYQIKVWDSTKIVDNLCKALLFEPGFTTFLHHPNKILELWESYYNESYSLSHIMLKLHELLHKAMSDRPFGFSARSLLDILGHDIFYQDVIPAILNGISYDEVCNTTWGKLALSRLTSMVLSGGINDPLIAYYQISLNNTNIKNYSNICSYELPGDVLDENVVHLATGPLSKGALQLSMLKLKYTIGLKISYELMKHAELNDIRRVHKLVEILYSNEKFPTPITCDILLNYLQSFNHNIEIFDKPLNYEWFKKIFQELPFYHPLTKQIVTCTSVVNTTVDSQESDWKILAEIISPYKKCNAWMLFKNFKEQLPKSANVGIAAVRFTSALTSVCQIMGICATRQKNSLTNTQNSLAKSLSQLVVYRLPTI